MFSLRLSFRPFPEMPRSMRCFFQFTHPPDLSPLFPARSLSVFYSYILFTPATRMYTTLAPHGGGTKPRENDDNDDVPLRHHRRQ